MTVEFRNEILRIGNVPHATYETRCFGCRKKITLYFNGGELDAVSCCGRRYLLEHTGIDFVVKPDYVNA